MLNFYSCLLILVWIYVFISLGSILQSSAAGLQCNCYGLNLSPKCTGNDVRYNNACELDLMEWGGWYLGQEGFALMYVLMFL